MHLIEIVSKQLPNMPTAYVEGLVLDRSAHHSRILVTMLTCCMVAISGCWSPPPCTPSHASSPSCHPLPPLVTPFHPSHPSHRTCVRRYHESLVLLLDGKVVGGITYRPFRRRRFIEIVFCVVHGTEAIDGLLVVPLIPMHRGRMS